MNRRAEYWAIAFVLAAVTFGSIKGCTTIFIEFEGECVTQQWSLAGINIRRRILCDLPPPTVSEGYLRDREPMDINPFPDLIDDDNKADSLDPNLLEKHMGVPQ